MMTHNPFVGTLSITRRWTRPAWLTMACLVAITALAMASSAADDQVELTQVTYTVRDADGDGFDDQVRVNATVHNTDLVQSRAFTLEVVLEQGASQVDLRTDDDRLDPNATVNLTIVVGTVTTSPTGTYAIKVFLHAVDLTGEVVDSDESLADLHPKGDYHVTVMADRTTAETLENTSVVFTLTVGSGSNNPTGVDISVVTTLGWSFLLDVEHLVLDPDGSALVGLTVEVPKNALAGSREVLMVEVVSARNSTAFSTTSVSVTVPKQEFELSMTLLTTQIFVASGQTVSIDGRVTNGGNNADNVTLMADVPPGWTAEFVPPYLLLSRGTQGSFVLHMTPPAGLKESGTTEMNVTALSMGLVVEAVIPLKVVFNTAELRVKDGGLSLTPTLPSSGEIVTLQVTVTNGGSITARNVLVVVTSDGGELARTIIDEVKPSGLGVATLKWSASPGPQLLRVTIDPDGDVPETDEGNNDATMTMDVTSPDLAVTLQDITMSPSYPTEGTDATVSVSISNLADQWAGPFDVTVSVEGDLLETFTVDTGLAGGANVTLDATWTAGPGRHEFTVVVDTLGQVPEDDLSNNGASRSFTVNRRPTASLVIHMTEVDVGDAVEMRADGSSDPDGRVRQYYFDYGDGTDSGWVWSPFINHTYSQSGTFEVRLYVRDEGEAQNEEPAMVGVTVAKDDTGDGDGDATPALPVPAVVFAMMAVAALATVLTRRREGDGS